MSQDPFEALGLAPRFDLDQAAIDRAYFALSAALHPDVAAGVDDAQRRMALLNAARDMLADPEQRADALLLRLGGPAREAHKSLPQDFLMEIMETREAVEAAAAERDPGERARAIRKWEAWAEDQRLRAIREVQGLFDQLGDSPAPEALAEIRTRLNAWRYIERLIEQLSQ